MIDVWESLSARLGIQTVLGNIYWNMRKVTGYRRPFELFL